MNQDRQTVDPRPGAVPEIRENHGGITFTMAPAGIPGHATMVIRCDAAGEIWISIGPAVLHTDDEPRGPSPA